MAKILMSACLLGHKVRYDGGDCLQNHARLQTWFDRGDIITICPEMAGGLTTPRPPAEIQLKYSGLDVLNNIATVKTNSGQDVSEAFIVGAQKALNLAKKHNIRIAILKSRSPSCGSDVIYDGTFTRSLIPGFGVTAALLQQENIFIFDEYHIDEALDLATNSDFFN